MHTYLHTTHVRVSFKSPKHFAFETRPPSRITMRRRSDGSIEDLSHATVRALRFGNLRHARDGWATLCTLHRHILANSRLRVEERDILATIAWSVRGDAADDFYFQREWFDGELWISCVQSRRRLRVLQAQTTSNDEAAYQGVDPYGDHAHEELVAHAPHEGVEQGVEPCGDHEHEELVAVKAESHLRSAGNFHIGLVAHAPRAGAPRPMPSVAKRPSPPCPDAQSPTLRTVAVKSEFPHPSGLAPLPMPSVAKRPAPCLPMHIVETRRTPRPSTARPSPSASNIRPSAARPSSESVDTGTVSSRPFTSAESL